MGTDSTGHYWGEIRGLELGPIASRLEEEEGLRTFFNSLIAVTF
jgi:hypothetical protein